MAGLTDIFVHQGTDVLTALADPVRYVAINTAWALMPYHAIELDEIFFLGNQGFPGFGATWVKDQIKGLGYDVLPWSREDYQRFWVNPRGVIDDGLPGRRLSGKPMNWHLQRDKGVIAPAEVLDMLNREMITERLAFQVLNIHFKGEQHLAAKYLELRNEIPPANDLITFAVKEAFDADAIQRLGYNKEFPIDLLQWAKKQGIGWESGFNMPPGATTTRGPDTRTKATWFDHHWWAHWQNLSPGQWFECLQRFYPNSPHGPSPEMLVSNQTVIADVETGLKIADYPDPLRSRLISLSYRPLTRVDIRRMYLLDILDDNAVYHSYRANGYDDARAEQLLSFAKRQKRDAKFGRIKNRMLNNLKRIVKAGMYDRATFQARLEAVGFTADEIDNEWLALQTEIDAQNLEGWVKTIRRNYIEGNLTEQNARDMLNRLQLIRSAIDLYIQTWNGIKFFGRKFITAGKAIDLYKKRIVNVQQLTNKLFNIGYLGPEISLMIQEANLDMTNQAQKQLVALDKQQAKDRLAARKAQIKAEQDAIKERAKAAKEQQTTKVKSLTTALKPFTQKNLEAWFKGKALNEAQVDSILTLQGWTTEAIVAFKKVNLGIGKETTTEGT